MSSYGYIRVSTQEQNEDRQRILMERVGIEKDKLFIDKVSGKDFERPEYNRMVKRLRSGDVLFIQSIDRLGRDYTQIQQQWRFLTQKIGIDICVLDMELLDTRRDKNLMGRFIADLVLQILSFVAESERHNINKRQMEGIAAAKARGVRFGRPPRSLPDNFYVVVKRWKKKEITLREATKLCNMSVSTFYRRMKEV